MSAKGLRLAYKSIERVPGQKVLPTARILTPLLEAAVEVKPLGGVLRGVGKASIGFITAFAINTALS